jgi:hypothetical protein
MDLLLLLRFRATHKDPSLVEMAEVIGDVEALYHAARRAVDARQPLLPIFVAERQAQAAQVGFSDEILAEIERGTRAIRALEREGADPDTIVPLRYAVGQLAVRQARAIERDERPALPRLLPDIPLHARRLSMASPLKVITSIPPEYWTGGGLALFLTAIERKFNFVKRIRTERLELAAREAKARADVSQAELRDTYARRVLQQLERRDAVVDDRQLEGIEVERPAFRLEEGVLSPEDPERPGHPLKGKSANRD